MADAPDMAGGNNNEVEPDEVPNLQLKSYVGMNTDEEFKHLVKMRSNGKEIATCCGSEVLIYNLRNPTQPILLNGHDQNVCCMQISESSKFLATGTVTHMGFDSEICIWDLEKKALVHKMTLHKTHTVAVAFSQDEKYLASIGGTDDNRIVVWDVETGKPLAANQIYMKPMYCISFVGSSPTRIVTAGEERIYVWNFDITNRVLTYDLVNLGQLKRVFTDILVESDPTKTSDGEQAFLATKTGDVIFINLNTQVYKGMAPSGKRPLPCAVECLGVNSSGNIVAIASDGTTILIRRTDFAIVQRCKLDGHVKALTRAKISPFYIALTTDGCLYKISEKTMEQKMVISVPSDPITDIFFAPELSRIVCTTSGDRCSVWDSITLAELLRINVPGITCTCGVISPDGGMIVTGWTDGAIRAFGPQTGKMLFTIRGAHSDANGALGVSALCYTSDVSKLFSGGDDGKLREWHIAASHQTLLNTVSMHTKRITRICIRKDDSELITSSMDGSCQIFELPSLRRLHELHDESEVYGLMYSDDETQLVSVSGDHFMSWWNCVSGEQIRKLEMSESSEITCCSLSPSGNFIAIGSNDMLIRLVGYDTGDVVAVGSAHSAGVLDVRFTPDERCLVSTARDGSMCIWDTSFLCD